MLMFPDIKKNTSLNLFDCNHPETEFILHYIHECHIPDHEASLSLNEIHSI